MKKYFQVFPELFLFIFYGWLKYDPSEIIIQQEKQKNYTFSESPWPCQQISAFEQCAFKQYEGELVFGQASECKMHAERHQ